MKKLLMIITAIAANGLLFGQSFVDGPVYIQSNYTGKVLTISSTAESMDAATLIQEPLRNGSNQKFYLEYAGDCTYKVTSLDGKYTLNIGSDLEAILLKGYSFLEPNFEIKNAGGGYYYFTSAYAVALTTKNNPAGQEGGFYFDIPSHSEQQKFKLLPAGAPSYLTYYGGGLDGRVLGIENYECCDLVVSVENTSNNSIRKEIRCADDCTYSINGIAPGRYNIILELRGKVDAIFSAVPSSVTIESRKRKEANLSIDTRSE